MARLKTATAQSLINSTNNQMAKTKKQTTFDLNSVLTTRFQLEPPKGIVSAVTVAFQDVALLRRFRESTPYQDLDTFVRSVVTDGISWLKRMTNGPEQFELHTMDYWKYDAKSEVLTLKNPKNGIRGYDVSFCMKFTRGNIHTHNEQIGLILNSFWYKTHATPLAIVELIAATDLLFSEHHGGISPAVASGVAKVSLSD